MMTEIRNIEVPPVNRKEVLRYAGCRVADENLLKLLDEALQEALPVLAFKLCFSELLVNISGDICDFGAFSVSSKDLAKNLSGCEKMLIFGATLGVGIDRLITKYAKISPSTALMLQAVGAERIEALCDAFCKQIEMEKGFALRPRFSPGYGDLKLSVQADIINLLEAPKKIGLTLNNSLLMSPTKSVTAFVGIGEKK
jgi:hypothetical protein